ncbi:hypothetical protein CLIB1423_27S01178 [[Candida] railenensis]|uniref:Uncharacterized protein n=1 Tax=[Candida] railenensis TaxID=45579 RepID=A0A9P0QUZ3_9ASCO|nr:hypothetical protein CLIB1423_27S01178 [[Candida] railenensis]
MFTKKKKNENINLSLVQGKAYREIEDMIESTEDLLNEYPRMRDVINFTDDNEEIQFNKDIGRLNRRSKIDDLTVFSDFNDNVTSDSIDREIENLLKDSNVPARNKRDSLNFDDDLGSDKTELIIRETHKLINSIPHGVFSSTQGENYQNLLTSSINKLVAQLEEVKMENRRLRNERAELSAHGKDQVAKLNEQVIKFELENRQLKSQLKIKENEASAKSLASDKERNLLRSKLIKYKQLYDNKVKEERSNQLKEHSKVEENKVKMDDDSLKELVLKIIRENESKQGAVKKESEHDEDKENQISEPNEKLSSATSKVASEIASLISAVESKKRKVKFTELNEEVKLDPPAVEQSHERSEPAADIVLKCVIEYPSESVKGKCNQCNSEEVLPKERFIDSGSDTVNLMGEYKWTI